MPVWSPGYYRVEDYAANVRELKATTTAGQPLSVEPTSASHWRVETHGEPSVQLFYQVFCTQRSVTTNEVTPATPGTTVDRSEDDVMRLPEPA